MHAARGILVRVQAAPFELAIALLLVLSGFRFLTKPAELEASQIGQTLPVPEIWATGYLVAGLLMFAGVLLPSPKVEAAGLSLMTAVVTINAIAFAYAYDIWAQWQFGVAFVFYVALAIAGLARLRVLLHGSLLVVKASDNAPEIVVGTVATPPREHEDGA